MSEKYGYIITALRNVVAICENEKSQVYIGNQNVKVFDTKQDANKFMKTSKFLSLNEVIPSVWNVIRIIKEKKQ